MAAHVPRQRCRFGYFQRFLERSGLPPDTPATSIASPFNYPEIATFHVPSMQSDPRDFDAHSDEVTRLLPDLLSAASVLHWCYSPHGGSSMRWLKPFEDLAEGLLVQGDGSKQALIAEHRRRIDEGEASHLVGVAFSKVWICRGTTVAMLSSSNCLSRYRMTPLTKPLLNGLRPRAGMPLRNISTRCGTKLVQACGRLIGTNVIMVR